MSEKLLPEKLSDCLELALADFAKCRESPMYQINMNNWHKPLLGKDVCTVCLAGSVIAQSLGIPPTTPTGPSDFSPHNAVRLEALDYLRTGQIHEAVKLLLPGYARPLVPEYSKDPEGFLRAMDDILQFLRKAGL